MAEEMNMDMQSMSTPEPQVQDFDMNAIMNGKPEQPNYAVPLVDKPSSSSPKAASDDFTKSMSQAINETTNDIFRDRDQPKTLQEKLNQVVGPKVRYTTDEAVDMYRYQEGFNPEGFDPFNEKNYQHWTEKETWSSALGKGMDSFATRFGNTYVDSFASYGRMADALFNWDWDKMMPSEDEMLEQNWAEYKESMKNFVFIDPTEEDDIISKRSVADFVGNAGFALGTVAALGTELVADAAITALSGGAGIGSFAATAGKFMGVQGFKAAARTGIKSMGIKGMARVGDFVSDVGKGAFRYANESAETLSSSAKIANKVKQAENLADAAKIGATTFRDSMKEVFDIMTLNTRGIFKSKSFGELATNIAKGTPLVGTGFRYGEKIVAGAKGGLSTGKLVGIGLQGARRMAQELNMSSTEAGFEAVTTYGSTLDMMIKNHEAENNGKPLTGEELTKMQEKAWQAAGANYNTNLALLMATNRLQFGGMFNKFTGSSRWAKDLLEEGAQKAFTVNKVFKGSKLAAQTYEKGFFGTYGLLGKISKDFGRKQAAYEFGKAFLKGFGKFELSEGLQENLQETSATGWMNYYAGQYNGTKYTLGQAFEKGINEQFTKQGLRTFLQGALTGMLISPAVKTQQYAMDKITEASMKSQYKEDPGANPYVKMKEQLKKDIDLQNQFFNQMSSKKYEDNIVTFTSHVDNTLQQTEAAARGAQYEWQNAQDNIMLAGALAANRTGTISAYRQAIRQIGEDMSDEEFETNFGIKLSDTKYSSAAEFAKDLDRDVAKYSDTIDAVRKRAKKIPDPMMYEANSQEQMMASLMHYAQEEAIKIIALNQIKGTRAAERATKLTQEMMSIPGLEASSDYAIRVLTNPEFFKGETGNILAEIRLLQEGLQSASTPEMKQELQEKIKIKQKKIDLIEKWMDFWDSEQSTEKRVNQETGEEIERPTVKYTRFKGRKESVVEKDENGNITNPNGEIFRLDHPEVVETFRDFINTVNKEAGITTELSETALYDSIDKIVDYIRLDQDSKDYLKHVDALFNPDNYRQTISRIQDGRFKYELLELLDSLNDGLRGSLMFAYAKNFNNQTELLEALKTFPEVLQKLEDEIQNSDAYKNLLTIVVTDEFGSNTTTFAKENLKKLNDFINAKIAEAYDRYIANDYTDDISDMDFMEFKATGKVREDVLHVIARKIKKGETLTENEGKIYDKYKTEIIKIKKFLDENLTFAATELSNQVTSNQDIIDSLKQKLIDDGSYTAENLEVLDNAQIYDIAFEKGLVTPEDLNFGSTSNDVITDEVFAEFENTGNVPDEILRSIAAKDAMGLYLSENEEKILEAKSKKIMDIQDEESPELNPNPVTENTEKEEQEEPEVTPVVEETKDDEEIAPSGMQGDGAELLQFFPNLGAEVTGNEAEGFNVTDGTNTEILNQPVETEEEAQEVKKFLI